jgi:hypothetical protein
MSGPSLRRTIRLGYAVVAVLALGAGALGVLNWRKHQAGGQAPAEDAVTVAVTDRACEPDSLTVPAGRVAFRILNRSQRMLEWEILDGVMVVEERENIAPGLSQRLVARLAPGEYAITCGLLGNPRGRLVVAPGKDGAPAAPDLRELVGPMAEYKVYLTLEGAMLAEAAARLADTVSAGRDAAEALAAAHAAYQHLRPAGRVMQADLDTALDARAADFARGAADPAFTGFRRLSLALGHEDAPALAARLAGGCDPAARAAGRHHGAAGPHAGRGGVDGAGGGGDPRLGAGGGDAGRCGQDRSTAGPARPAAGWGGRGTAGGRPGHRAADVSRGPGHAARGAGGLGGGDRGLARHAGAELMGGMA